MHIIWPSIIHMYIYTIYIIYIILFGLYRFACLEISRTSIILVNVARVYIYIYKYTYIIVSRNNELEIVTRGDKKERDHFIRNR